MDLKGKNGWAIVLIVLGSLILLDKLNFGFGHLMGYVIPVIMVLLGYVGVKNGSKFFGWVILVIGIMILLGKLSGLIGLAIAIGLIFFGVSMFKKDRRAY